MKFKILSYDEYSNSHGCIDEKGKKRKIDFLVSGDFPPGTTKSELVGKTIEAKRIFPHIEIAEECRIVEEAMEKN